MKYDFREIEPKWQKKWDDEGVFRAGEDHSKPKFYGLVEFPYPSGAGMHVGHIKAYSGHEHREVHLAAEARRFLLRLVESHRHDRGGLL